MSRIIGFAIVAITVAGCSKPVRVAPKPTAFFEWCATEKFGENSPNGIFAQQSGTDLVGRCEIRQLTLAKSKDEAETHLKNAAGRLLRESMARGCQLKESTIGAEKIQIVYDGDGVVGRLDGQMESVEDDLGGKTAPAWYIRLKLVEVERPR